MAAAQCTIVIATYNRRARLATTLQRLTRLSERPQIVVVDNGSSDGTAAHVGAVFPAVRVIELPKNIGAAARNVGVRAALTPYVAFCDDDCWWSPGSIARGIELLHENADVGLINARVVVDETRVDAACSLMETSRVPKRSACPGTAIVQFMAGASMVRREAFLQAGGYHERYHIGAEESLLALDLLDREWELIYDPSLVVHHEPYRLDRAPRARRIAVMRNRLWTAWLRLSPSTAAIATMQLLSAARSDRTALTALLKALCGLPWILRERRPVQMKVERLTLTVDTLP